MWPGELLDPVTEGVGAIFRDGVQQLTVYSLRDDGKLNRVSLLERRVLRLIRDMDGRLAAAVVLATVEAKPNVGRLGPMRDGQLRRNYV